MRRRDWDYLVIALMILSGLYVTGTGIVMDLLGLHQLLYHSYAGYICAGLAVLHVALNWQRITAYVRRIGRGQERPRRRTITRPKKEAMTTRRDVIIAGLSAGLGFLIAWLLPGRRTPDLPGDARDLGALYHQWSKPGLLPELDISPDWGNRPPRYKTYPEAERIALPDPDPGGNAGLSVEKALEMRRSVRNYAGGPISLQALSRLLHAAQGITEERMGFRAAPSAGALYPIEIYPVVHNAETLKAGIYHYAIQEHALERLQEGNFRDTVTLAGLGQEFLGQANVCFVLSAIFQRTRWRYHERAYRYVMIETGHVGQNLYLTATSMGLGACAVGAFFDDRLNDPLGLDGTEETAVYLISVGKA